MTDSTASVVSAAFDDEELRETEKLIQETYRSNDSNRLCEDYQAWTSVNYLAREHATSTITLWNLTRKLTRGHGSVNQVNGNEFFPFYVRVDGGVKGDLTSDVLPYQVTVQLVQSHICKIPTELEYWEFTVDTGAEAAACLSQRQWINQENYKVLLTDTFTLNPRSSPSYVFRFGAPKSMLTPVKTTLDADMGLSANLTNGGLFLMAISDFAPNATGGPEICWNSKISISERV